MVNIRKKCTNCNKVYIGDGYKEVCTKDCYYKKSYENRMVQSGRDGKQHKVKPKKLYEKICATCAEEFECNIKNGKYCSLACADKGRRSPEEEKIRKANERWFQPKKEFKHKKSFGRLNREAEWRRVWDDESWKKAYNFYRG